MTVNKLEPAEVNVGGRRVIGVCSIDSFDDNLVDFTIVPELGSQVYNPLAPTQKVKLFSGYSRSMNNDIAKASEESLVKALQSTNFFKVVGPELTDNIVELGMILGNTQKKLLEQGIELLLKVSTPNISFDEMIYSQQAMQYIKPHVKVDGTAWAGGDALMGVEYILKQTYSMSISYTLLAVDTGDIVSSGTVSKKGDRLIKVADSLYPLTSVGDPDYTKAMNYRAFYFSSEFPKAWYTDFFTSTVNDICRKLAPYTTQSSYELLKIDDFKEAYKLVNSGYYQQAQSMFLGLWQSQRNPDALYNAALLQWAMGDIAGCYSMVQEGLGSSWSSQLQQLSSNLEYSLKRQKLAESQVAGNDKPSEIDNFQIKINQIFGQ